MAKPPGISFSVSESDCALMLKTIFPSKVEDAIWDAVEEAINNGWTPEQFKNEVASAWKDRLKQDGEHAERVLSK